MKLTYAEQVVDLLISHISLSRYDKRFMVNLQILNVNTRKPITTNQLALYKKVVTKYHRQLLKMNHNSVELAELPWEVEPVQSDEFLSKAHLHIMDGNKLTLHSPYRPKFVKEFRELALMQWQHDDKYYLSDYSLYKLRSVLDIVNKHYVDVIYCDEIRKVLTEINQYREMKYWEPTLIKRQGNLYIAANNDSINEVLQDIKLEDTFECLMSLTRYGIKIDEDILDNYTDMEIKLISSHEIKHEMNDLKGLRGLLEKIGCDFVMCLGGLSNENAYKLKKTLRRWNFTVGDNREKNSNVTPEVLKSKKHPVLIKYTSMGYTTVGGKFMSRVIQLVNTEPIVLNKK